MGKNDLDPTKHWVVPVRAWARNDEWQGADGEPVGSHTILCEDIFIFMVHQMKIAWDSLVLVVCIRMSNQDIIELFDLINVGAKVLIS